MITVIDGGVAERAANTPRQEATDAAAVAMRTDGCVMLQNVFAPQYVEALCAAFMARHPDVAGTPATANEVGNRRFQCPIDFSPPFADPSLYANALVLSIVRACLGEEVVLGSVGVVASLPGAKEQHVHRDGPLLFNKSLNRMMPPYAIDLFVPLVDFNEETGTTRLFPGTHTNGDLEPADAPPVDPVVPAGSCVLADYRLYHQGRANQSNVIRPLLYCVYQKPWFKDYKNHTTVPFFRMTDGEYARIPPEHRQLLSWTEHYRSGLY